MRSVMGIGTCSMRATVLSKVYPRWRREHCASSTFLPIPAMLCNFCYGREDINNTRENELEEGKNIRDFNCRCAIAPHAKVDRRIRTAVKEARACVGSKTEKEDALYNWYRERYEQKQNEGGEDEHGREGCEGKHGATENNGWCVEQWQGFYR